MALHDPGLTGGHMHRIALGFKKKFPQAANKFGARVFSRNGTGFGGDGHLAAGAENPRPGEVGGNYFTADPRRSNGWSAVATTALGTWQKNELN
jgi:hypothetical protein